MLSRVCVLAVAGLSLAFSSSAVASGSADNSVIPVGTFAVEQNWADVSYPLAQGLDGPLPMALVLVAAQGYVEHEPTGPDYAHDEADPFAPPKENPQVPGTIKLKLDGRDLPDWDLQPRQTAYVIGWNTIRSARSFKSGHLSLRIAMKSECLALRMSILAMPDFTRIAGEQGAAAEGPLSAFAGALTSAPARTYFDGLAAEIAGDLPAAKDRYAGLANAPDAEIARFARRGLRMIDYHDRPHKLSGNIVEHLRWGYYLQFGGYYAPAFKAFDEVRIIESSQVEAQFRGGETLERIGGDTLSTVHYFNRTGEATPYENPSIWQALVVIVKSRGAKMLSDEEIINIKDSFIVLDRVLWAASRGAFRLGISFHEIEKEDADTMTRHLGRVTGPPDDLIRKRGWYDTVFCVRPRLEGEERASVEIGWTDVGPNGAALASFFHDSPFSAYMRAIYSQIYAAADSIGATQGWPDPRGALAAGFQPSRFESSALRAALRYHVSPADLSRLAAADEPVDLTYLKLWKLEGPIPFPSSGDTRRIESDWPARDTGVRKIVAEDDFIDLAERFVEAGAVKIRATTWVFSPQREDVWIRLGRNDMALMQLNGRTIISAPSLAGGKFEGRNLVDTAFTRATLEEGWNEMQLVVASRPSEKNKGWGYSVSITTLAKQPVAGLACTFDRPTERLAPRAAMPQAGDHYEWSAVKGDFHTLLPRLSDADLQRITGISDLVIRTSPARVSPFVAIESPSRKPDATYRLPSDWTAGRERDVALNNVLDWSREMVAAIRYRGGAAPRELLLVRAEALENVMFTLKEPPDAKASFEGRKPSERLLGWIDFAPYGTVFVLDAVLGDNGGWPVDEEDILTPYGPFVPNWPEQFLEGPPLPSGS